MARRIELDTGALYEAIVETAESRGVSLRQAMAQAGVSHNTTTRLKAGRPVEVDIFLALMMWLKGRSGIRAIRQYTREVDDDGPAVPEEGHAHVA